MKRRTPAHWHSHVGPSDWYRVWHPPTWKVTVQDNLAHFHAPNGEGVLSLHCFWSPEAETFSLDSVVDLHKLFRNPRDIRRLQPLDLPYRSLGLTGHADSGTKRSWWRSLFVPPEKVRWNLWVMQHESICLVAALQHGRQSNPEWMTLVGLMLQSLTLADQPADPPHIFADRALQLARSKFPLLDCRLGQEFQLKLGKSNINLFNFYRSYLKSPHSFEEIMLPALTTMVQVQEWGSCQTEPPLREVRRRVLPMLYPEPIYRENFADFAATPWVADLVVLYVIDEPHAYRYIRKDLMRRWNLTEEELHRLALRNLDEYFARTEMEFTLAGEEDGPRLLIPNRADAYNTARLLSQPFHQKLRELLGREFAVGVPSRDVFVAVSLDCQETIDSVREKVRTDYTHLDHPLSRRLLLVSADGVSEYCDPHDSWI